MINIQLFGIDCPPYFNESEFYAKKKADAIKEIIKQVEIIKECDIALSKEKNDN